MVDFIKFMSIKVRESPMIVGTEQEAIGNLARLLSFLASGGAMESVSVETESNGRIKSLHFHHQSEKCKDPEATAAALQARCQSQVDREIFPEAVPQVHTISVGSAKDPGKSRAA